MIDRMSTPLRSADPAGPAVIPGRQRWRVVLIVAVVLVASLAGAQSDRAYTISIVPQFPTLVLAERWQPLLNELERQLDVRFEMVLAPTIPEFEAGFLAGAYDFAFMNPYHVVMAHEAQGYEPLVSDASRELKGILVVRADGPLESVAELDGTTIAFPAPNAFGASLYMRALLTNVEGIDFTPAYVETHGNSYRHALLGRASAGGGVRNTLRAEPDGFQDQVRVLYETPGVTPHPLTAHPDVPAALQQELTSTLLRLAESEDGRALLDAVQLAEPFAADYEEHYAPLVDLRLDAFVVR